MLPVGTLRAPVASPRASSPHPRPRTTPQPPGQSVPATATSLQGCSPAPHSPAQPSAQRAGPTHRPASWPCLIATEVPEAWGWGCPGAPSCPRLLAGAVEQALGARPCPEVLGESLPLPAPSLSSVHLCYLLFFSESGYGKIPS